MPKKQHVVTVLGPIGLSMDDGWSRIDYIKMRAIVVRELKKLLIDGRVQVITNGLPWSGIVMLDALSKLKDDRVSVRLELPSRFDEIHTPDGKMWDGRFSGDIDGSSANAAHFGFRRVTGVQSLKMLYEASTKWPTSINNGMRGSFYSILRRANTVIVFPTADVMMRELISEFKERKKEIIEIKPHDLIYESVAPRDDRLTILKRAVSILEEDEHGLIDNIPGDIFVSAIEIIHAAAAKAKARKSLHRSSPCMTDPPD